MGRDGEGREVGEGREWGEGIDMNGNGSRREAGTQTAKRGTSDDAMRSKQASNNATQRDRRAASRDIRPRSTTHQDDTIDPRETWVSRIEEGRMEAFL